MSQGATTCLIGINSRRENMRDYRTCLVPRCRVKKDVISVRVVFVDGFLQGGLCPVHAQPLTALRDRAQHKFVRVVGTDDRRFLTRFGKSTFEEIRHLQREYLKTHPAEPEEGF